MGTKFTRHRFLTAVSAGVTYLALTNTVGCELPKRTSKVVPLPNVSSAPAKGVWAFRSRPDLSPPALAVTTQAHSQTPGYIFVAPKGHPGQNGSMILDKHGQLVWFYPRQNRGGIASDFKTQRYRGEPVLTWAEGKVVAGHGITEYVILDGSYQEITRVRAGNGYRGDLHEFLITPEDTALMTIYNPVRRDLSPIGGSKDSVVWEGIVQEVDIEMGEVLFEWHSLDHVGLDESYGEPPKKPKWGFDYFHINSIDVDHDGNLLVGGHTTFTVYKVDHNSGK